MSKPEDVSQEAWDTAEEIMDWIKIVVVQTLSTAEEVALKECAARLRVGTQEEERCIIVEELTELKYKPSQGIDGEMASFNDGVDACIRAVNKRLGYND